MPRRSARMGKHVPGLGRVTKSGTDAKPNIYEQMLAEEAMSSTSGDGSERPRKRLRAGKGGLDAESLIESVSAGVEQNGGSKIALETPLVSQFQNPRDQMSDGEELPDEESEESEVDWEEVDMDEHSDLQDSDDAAPEQQGEISLVFGQPSTARSREPVKQRTQPLLDKRVRVEVHKLHVLCLLAHAFLRNHWCNDPDVQAVLRPQGGSKIRKLLFPDPLGSQAVKTALFTDGLVQVCQMWQQKFRVTAVGQRASQWARSAEEIRGFQLVDHAERRVGREEFLRAAGSLEGSQDTGAALLCAFLRAIGVDARLVCSLQTLNLASAPSATAPATPTSAKKTIYLRDADEEAKAASAQPETSAAPAIPPPRVRAGVMSVSRIGGRNLFKDAASMDLGKPRVHTPSRTVREPYPVFWVEVFNKHIQKWIPVDPLATGTVGRPLKLEPPLAYRQNVLAYVVAFERDGVARDVTRRYAKAYNGKTRRFRVESVDGGDAWMKRAMRLFKRQRLKNRDQVEAAELASKEAQEPMPRNVQDFKDHPYYVLERHLRQNEVLHPKTEVGRVLTGHRASYKQEAVFRRRDVHIVRSADKWFRMGREVKEGEQPLKYAIRKKAISRSGRRGSDSSLDGRDDRKALYAVFQTEQYIPPPVFRGRVPRNAYGNLDVYVPSMIPQGAVHIRAPFAARAARLVGVDFADAVTGFQFQGRSGSAVIQGIIVAAEYQEAVNAVVEGLQDAETRSKETERSNALLGLWRRFTIGLRIAQRIEREHGAVEGGSEAGIDGSEVGDQLREEEDEPMDTNAGTTEHDEFTRLLPDDERFVGFENDDLTKYKPEPKRRVWIERPVHNIVDYYDSLDFRAEVASSSKREQSLLDRRAGPSGSNRALPTPATDREGTGDFIDGKGKKPVTGESLPIAENRDHGTMQSKGPTEEHTGVFIPDDPIPATEKDVSDIDASSLLSRDPEDEDAEPEWLMSDGDG